MATTMITTTNAAIENRFLGSRLLAKPSDGQSLSILSFVAKTSRKIFRHAVGKPVDRSRVEQYAFNCKSSGLTWLPEKKKKTQIVDSKEVARIASLAKISLTPLEEDKYSRELSAILEYFRVMDRAEVEEIDSDRSAKVTNSFRGEEVVRTDPEPILGGVPEKRGRLVKAPRVF